MNATKAKQKYAIIKTGGKQYRVSEGQVLDVELLQPPASKSASQQSQKKNQKVDLQPVMLVDGSEVLATTKELSKAKVTAELQEVIKSPKINGFIYKSKSNQRRRWGHRQQLSRIQITKISNTPTKS